MACNYTLQNISLNRCMDNMGGVSRVWVADRAKFNPSNITPVAGVFEFETAGEGILASSDFVELAFEANVSTFTATASFTEGVGFSYSTEASLEFYRMDAAKREAIDSLVHNNQMIAIVLDSNDVAHFMGWDYGVKASAMVATTGTALTDVNNYQVTLQDTTRKLNYIVKSDDAILSALKAAAKPIAQD